MPQITKDVECPLCDEEFELAFDPADPEDREVDCPECQETLEIEYDPQADEVTLVEIMDEAEQPEDVEADDEEDEEEEI